MSRRVYIHQAPGLGGQRKALFVGVAAAVGVLVVLVQAQLTFSERAIARARDEFSLLGEDMRSGVEGLTPEEGELIDMKDVIADTNDAFAAERELQEALSAAASSAAASLGEEDSPSEDATTETTTDTAPGTTSEPSPSPEPTTTTP